LGVTPRPRMGRRAPADFPCTQFPRGRTLNRFGIGPALRSRSFPNLASRTIDRGDLSGLAGPSQTGPRRGRSSSSWPVSTPPPACVREQSLRRIEKDEASSPGSYRLRQAAAKPAARPFGAWLVKDLSARRDSVGGRRIVRLRPALSSAISLARAVPSPAAVSRRLSDEDPVESGTPIVHAAPHMSSSMGAAGRTHE